MNSIKKEGNVNVDVKDWKTDLKTISINDIEESISHKYKLSVDITKWIFDEKTRENVISILNNNIPDYFWWMPSTITYTDISNRLKEKGGLYRHSYEVTFHTNNIIRLNYGIKNDNYEGATYYKNPLFTKEQADKIIVAGLLHDSYKFGIGDIPMVENTYRFAKHAEDAYELLNGKIDESSRLLILGHMGEKDLDGQYIEKIEKYKNKGIGIGGELWEFIPMSILTYSDFLSEAPYNIDFDYLEQRYLKRMSKEEYEKLMETKLAYDIKYTIRDFNKNTEFKKLFKDNGLFWRQISNAPFIGSYKYSAELYCETAYRPDIMTLWGTKKYEDLANKIIYSFEKYGCEIVKDGDGEEA